MRKTLLTAAAFGLALTASAAQAQRGRGPGRMGGGPGARCAQTADSLTDNQKAQIKTLNDAFVAAHQSSLDSLRAVMQAARAARQAGKTPEEVRAIMETGKPISDALAPARKEQHDAVLKLLTQAQIDAGCIPPVPGGGPMGGRGRRGGPPPAFRE